MADALSNPRICKRCGAPDCEFKCPCKVGYYCSRKCQKADWHSHKKNCAFALVGDVKDAETAHGKDDLRTAEARTKSGCSFLNQGRLEDAEHHYLEARRIFCSVHGKGHQEVGHADHALGIVYSGTRQYGKAHAFLKESLKIFRKTLGEKSSMAGRVLAEIANLLKSQGKFEEALDTLHDALSICTEAAGPRHHTVATCLFHMGGCYRHMKRLDEALTSLKKALVIERINLASGESEVPRDVTEIGIGSTLGAIGSVQVKMGLLEEAKESYGKDLEICRRIRGERHNSVATSLSNIADVLRMQGHLDDALDMQKKALKIRRRALGDDHEDVGRSLVDIACIYEDRREYGEAVEMHTRAIAFTSETLGADARDIATIHGILARVKTKSGDTLGALESAKQSAEMFARLGIKDADADAAAERLRALRGGQR